MACPTVGVVLAALLCATHAALAVQVPPVGDVEMQSFGGEFNHRGRKPLQTPSPSQPEADHLLPRTVAVFSRDRTAVPRPTQGPDPLGLGHRRAGRKVKED